MTVSRDPLLQRALALCPLLQRGLRPPAWCSNAHLQFIPWLFQNEVHRLLLPVKYERHTVAVTDRPSKTAVPRGLRGRGTGLEDRITVDIFPALGDAVLLPPSAPVIVFAPGLRCHSQDLPGTTPVRRALAGGFRSVVVNRRGHTPGQPLAAPRWNLFGDVDDLEQVYWELRDLLSSVRRTDEGGGACGGDGGGCDGAPPLFLCGLSSGCGLVVNALGVWDKRRSAGDASAPAFAGALSLAPGYDITTCLARFDWPYEPLLLANVKAHFVAKNETVLRRASGGAVDACLGASSLQAFLEAATPFTGYGDAEAYYAHCNPVNEVHAICTPMLIVNARDDPCCKVGNALEASRVPAHGGRTYRELVAASPRSVLCLSASGSHCPFLDGGILGFRSLAADPLALRDGGGGVMLNSWADAVAVEWFTACRKVFKEGALEASTASAEATCKS